MLRDAASIKGRQETDTIDIIDELRFAIKQHHVESGDSLSIIRKEEILAGMLNSLGFDI